jgi:hypothetical protein
MLCTCAIPAFAQPQGSKDPIGWVVMYKRTDGQNFVNGQAYRIHGVTKKELTKNEWLGGFPDGGIFRGFAEPIFSQEQYSQWRNKLSDQKGSAPKSQVLKDEADRPALPDPQADEGVPDPTWGSSEANYEGRNVVRVHTLWIIDTDAEGLSGWPKVSGQKMLAAVRDPLQQHGVLGYSCVLDGTNATATQVLGWLHKLSRHRFHVKRQDVLFVYYNGHGGMNAQQEHILGLRHGQPLKRTILRSYMEKVPGTLKVLLTDSCASQQWGTAPSYAAAPTNWTTLKQLLVESKGWVSVNSCKPLKSARIGPGGALFSVLFTRALAAKYDPPVTWPAVLDKVDSWVARARGQDFQKWHGFEMQVQPR